MGGGRASPLDEERRETASSREGALLDNGKDMVGRGRKIGELIDRNKFRRFCNYIEEKKRGQTMYPTFREKKEPSNRDRTEG